SISLLPLSPTPTLFPYTTLFRSRTTLDADFVVQISPRDTFRFFRGIEEAGVKADIQKIRRQLESGYNIITVTDKLSPHTADLILDRKSTRLNSSHVSISYAVFCL